jgi:hypothetical protein
VDLLNCPKCGKPMREFVRLRPEGTSPGQAPCPCDAGKERIHVCFDGLVDPGRPHFNLNVSFFSAEEEEVLKKANE